MGKLITLVVAILVSRVAEAKPTQTCVSLRIMESLATADSSAMTNDEGAMVTAARVVRCATGEEPERWDWPNGKTARHVNGTYDYPNGATALNAAGRYEYPNRNYFELSGGGLEYADTKTARTSSGDLYLPDGTAATAAEILTKICTLDAKGCKKHMAAYKARRGTSRSAWLFATVFRLWRRE